MSSWTTAKDHGRATMASAAGDGVPAREGALAGKAAIITGAATGIGRASAILFAQAGARVALVDVRQPEVEAAAEAVRSAAGPESAVAFVADLAQPEACAAAVAQ